MALSAAVLEQVESYARDTLPYSKSLTKAELARWLDTFRKSSDSSDREGNRLPTHGGPRRLLPYQYEAYDEAVRILSSGERAILISLPTGAGKTLSGLAVVLHLLGERFRRCLWLAPQGVLLDQAQAELRRTWWEAPRTYDLSLGLLGSPSPRTTSQGRLLSFATIQSSLNGISSAYDLVVIDECHHLHANQFGGLASAAKDLGAALIGLTATPGRYTEEEIPDLVEIFDGRLITPNSLGTDPIEALQNMGVYARVRFKSLEPTVELDSERIARISASVSARNRIFAHSPGRLDASVDFLTALARPVRALAFCATTAHACVMAAALSTNGLTAQVLGSAFGDRHNRGVLSEFRAGRIDVLSNAKYAAIGTDLPQANVALLTVPISSPIFFEQIVGRVARGPRVGGTETAIVADFDEHRARLGGMSSYGRFLSHWDQ